MSSTLSTSITPSNPTSVYGAIPGLNTLLSTSGGNISNLLSGLPSAPWARTTAAYAGAGSGQPGGNGALGTFEGNMGADLYHTQANQNQQQGLSDLLQLIGTAGGNLAPTAGQNAQLGLGYSQLGQQGAEFNQDAAMRNFMNQINAIGTLGSLAGSGGGGGQLQTYA